MVDLMNLLSDVLIGSFQMLMLNDLGKNMFPYRIKTCWTRILIYGVTALVILGVNHIESTFINIMMVPVSYTIASIVIFQGSVWKKIILTCCYYMLAIVPEFLFAVITGAYGVTGTENNFHSELEKLLSLLLMSTITFLLVKCVNQITRKKNYQTIENKLFTVLLTLPAATIIIFMCIYYSQISYTGVNRIMIPKDSDEYVLNLEIKNVLSDIWYMKLETQIPMVQELIRGTVSASNLLTNGYLSPEELLVQGSDTVIFLEHVTKVIKHDSKVAVLGARTGLAVEMLLNNNLDRNVELTLIDESAGMLKRAEERLRRYDVQFEYYHFEDGLLEKSLLGQFDFVIALGELHRYKNPLHGLHVANMLLKAKGQLLALEYEELDPMSIISSAILENGFSEYMRKRKNTALMTVDEWLTAFEESAFDDVMIKVYPTSSALFINANANKYKECEKKYWHKQYYSI